MMDFSPDRLARLSGMLKRRGVILPAFEIHGGVAGLYDFGPVGGRLRSKVIQKWINHWQALGNIVEISSPTVTPFSVLEASGHVGEFSDYLTECLECNEASRADHLVEKIHPNADSLSKDDLAHLIEKNDIQCPNCGNEKWGELKSQNLMFNTKIGVGSSARDGFLRPETAQGMFTSFPALYRHFRERLPFGAIQTGKGYRNEISPRQGMIRLREFNMAELEYFIDPNSDVEHDFSNIDFEVILLPDDEKEIRMNIKKATEKGIIRHPTVGYFMALTFDFLVKVGIDPKYIRFRQHLSTEMAHYAQDCWDAEILGSYGWIECVGIAHRGCYDLEAHENATGQRLRAWRLFDEPKEIENDGWTVDAAKAGPAFRQLSQKVKEYVETLPPNSNFPHTTIIDGTEIEIQEEHVKRNQTKETLSGEWYIPHVVEPAFGIDRIIWHLLDHSFNEIQKSDEIYNRLELPQVVAPVDVAVLPLFEKDGMEIMAQEIHNKICSQSDMFSVYDASGSIGRRYARADEIGVPICITVDHDSLVDGTVTVRQRDTTEQHRVDIDELPFF